MPGSPATRTMPSIHSFLSGLALLLALLASSLTAQRPKTASDALERWQKVQDQPEAERKRAVQDLGDFDSPEITAALLAEAERAQELAHVQTVVRALGSKPRPGAVPALRKAFQQASNNRLMESAAEGLANQGDAGVQALGELLAAEPKAGARRFALCDGLGRATGDRARDLLLGELKLVGGRDRLPLLRALANRADDALVDAARLSLCSDKDALVAATALRQLADHRHAEAPNQARLLLKRLGADASSEHYTAALRGLLVAPATAEPELVLAAAARAEDPFGQALAPAWAEALGHAAFLRWFVDQAAQRKAPAERTLAAQVLGMAPAAQRPSTVPTLLRLLGNKEIEVVRATVQALVGCGAEAAAAPLQKLLQTGAESLQPIALHALHELQGRTPAFAEQLVQLATTAKGAPLRAAALQLLPRLPQLAPDSALAAATGNLGHAAWPVRSAAIDVLVHLRHKEAIPLLIDRLEAERGRLQLDVTDALYELTALRFADATAWRAFWARDGAGFTVPASPKQKAKDKARETARDKAPQTVASYWNIPVRSDRVAFVVDVSGSMNQPFGTGGSTRLDEAKRQLVRVFGMLPAKAKANVITFATGTDAWATGLQAIDDKVKKAFEPWAQALATKGATNVHAGLQRAFADPEVDTIFLLTDGQPSTGEIVATDALARAVQQWNLGRSLRIHTIALGGKSDFLERLARESGGEHTVAR